MQGTDYENDVLNLQWRYAINKITILSIAVAFHAILVISKFPIDYILISLLDVFLLTVWLIDE